MVHILQPEQTPPTSFGKGNLSMRLVGKLELPVIKLAVQDIDGLMERLKRLLMFLFFTMSFRQERIVQSVLLLQFLRYSKCTLA